MCRPFFQRNRQVSLPGLSKGRYTTPGASRTRIAGMISDMAQGAVYGLIIWVAWHVILMPLFGTVPAPWDQPFEEHFSEILGHVVWAWSIAATAFFLIKHQKINTLTYLE